MQLQSVLTLLESEHELDKTTKWQYRLCVRRFSEYLERPATTDDLTSEHVNLWLAWLQKFKLKPASVRNHRSGLIRVWNYASDTLRTAPDCPVRRIRRPKVPAQIVRAWTLDELSILMQAAAGLGGRLKCGIPASEFMVAWIWVAYETGLRPIDLRLLTWQNIDFASATVTVVQHKTGGIHTSSIGPESVAYLKNLQKYGQQNVFPLCKYGVRRWEEILYRAAKKLGFNRLPNQGIGTLRKTHATEIYRQHGLAAAAESLGHRSGTSVARDHYIDARLRISRLPPSPQKRA